MQNKRYLLRGASFICRLLVATDAAFNPGIVSPVNQLPFSFQDKLAICLFTGFTNPDFILTSFARNLIFEFFHMSISAPRETNIREEMVINQPNPASRFIIRTWCKSRLGSLTIILKTHKLNIGFVYYIQPEWF